MDTIVQQATVLFPLRIGDNKEPTETIIYAYVIHRDEDHLVIVYTKDMIRSGQGAYAMNENQVEDEKRQLAALRDASSRCLGNCALLEPRGQQIADLAKMLQGALILAS